MLGEPAYSSAQLAAAGRASVPRPLACRGSLAACALAASRAFQSAMTNHSAAIESKVTRCANQIIYLSLLLETALFRAIKSFKGNLWAIKYMNPIQIKSINPIQIKYMNPNQMNPSLNHLILFIFLIYYLSNFIIIYLFSWYIKMLHCT